MIKKIIKIIKKPRGSILLIYGTLIGQASLLAVSPILTRLYTPYDFGIFAVYLSALAIVGAVSTLRYEIAIPFPKSDGSAFTIMLLAIFCTLFVASMCFLLITLCSKLIEQSFEYQIYAGYEVVISFGIFLIGLNSIFYYWCLRSSAFNANAWSRFLQGFITAAFQLIFGFLGLIGAKSLIVAYIIGLVASAIPTAMVALRMRVLLIKRVNIHRIAQNARRHRNLPIYSSSGALVNSLGLQLPVLLFSTIYGATTTGFFFLAQRFSNAPISLIAESIGKTFYVQAVEANRNGSLVECVESKIENLLKISVVPLSIISIISPNIFYVFFGSGWTVAGEFTQAMIIWMISSFIFVPFLNLFTVLDLHKWDMIMQLTLTTSRVVGLLLGSIIGDAYYAILGFSLLSALVYIIFGIKVLLYAGVKIKFIVNIFSRESKLLLVCVFLLSACKIVLKYMGLDLILHNTLIIICGVFIAVSFLYIRLTGKNEMGLI